jgi:hypothetical protein
VRACLAVLLFALCSATGWGADTTATFTRWSVHFSPRGGCTEAVVAELNRARQCVLAQAYSFASAPIAKALIEAHRRGVMGIKRTAPATSIRTGEVSG